MRNGPAVFGLLIIFASIFWVAKTGVSGAGTISEIKMFLETWIKPVAFIAFWGAILWAIADQIWPDKK